MIRVLGLSGKRGAGKDSVAAFLIRNAATLFPGWVVVRVGLADAVKEQLLVRFPRASRVVFYGDDAAKEAQLPGAAEGVTYRRAAQIYGTAVADIDPLYWVREFATTVARQAQAYPRLLVLCTDVRFPKEVHAIHIALPSLAGKAMPKRPYEGLVTRLLRCRTEDSHISETALDDFTGFISVIDNSLATEDERNARVLQALLTHHWIEEI